jgi:hypothetical protein
LLQNLPKNTLVAELQLLQLQQIFTISISAEACCHFTPPIRCHRRQVITEIFYSTTTAKSAKSAKLSDFERSIIRKQKDTSAIPRKCLSLFLCASALGFCSLVQFP